MTVKTFLSHFSFQNLGHYVAVIARDIVHEAPVVDQTITKAEELADVAVPAASPTAAEITRAAHTALGYIVDAAQHVTQVADGTNTLTLQGLTAAELADFQKLAAFFKSHASTNGVVLPAGNSGGLPIPNTPTP